MERQEQPSIKQADAVSDREPRHEEQEQQDADGVDGLLHLQVDVAAEDALEGEPHHLDQLLKW